MTVFVLWTPLRVAGAQTAPDTISHLRQRHVSSRRQRCLESHTADNGWVCQNGWLFLPRNTPLRDKEGVLAKNDIDPAGRGLTRNHLWGSRSTVTERWEIKEVFGRANPEGRGQLRGNWSRPNHVLLLGNVESSPDPWTSVTHSCHRRDAGKGLGSTGF